MLMQFGQFEMESPITSDLKTPLHVACANSLPDVAQELLKFNRVWVNAQDTDGMTPLMEAALSGSTECLDLLISAPGRDIYLKTNSGG